MEKNDFNLRCKFCKSKNVIYNNGFVCQDCGAVFDEPLLQYDTPYKEESLQHQRLVTGVGTTIGNAKERFSDFKLKTTRTMQRFSETQR